ncbi:MAG: hypothetical protein QXX65_01740 [Candidatus Woesearchaeota archaeon]
MEYEALNRPLTYSLDKLKGHKYCPLPREPCGADGKPSNELRGLAAWLQAF